MEVEIWWKRGKEGEKEKRESFFVSMRSTTKFHEEECKGRRKRRDFFVGGIEIAS